MNQTITLNLPYNLSDEDWQTVQKVYENIDGWKGYIIDGCPTWFGSENDERYVWASVEPSGLLLSGNLPNDIWAGWLTVLCAKLSVALNLEIHDSEM